MGLAYLKSGGSQGRSLEGTRATGGLPPVGEPKLDAARARIMDAMKANSGTSVELTNKGRAFTKRQMPY